MIYVSLIKYIVVALLLCGLVFLIHNNGRKVERAEWLQKQADYQQQLAKDVGEAMRRKAAIENDNNENIARAINEKDEELKKLDADIAAMRASNRGLYLSAKACRSNAMPGKAESTGEHDSSTDSSGKIRLPPETEQDIYTVGHDAKELVIRYNKLRKLCLPLVVVVD